MLLYGRIIIANKRGDFMNMVEPIREIKKIQKMKTEMIEDGAIKMALLFAAGTTTGLRIGDLLKITHAQMRKEKTTITESKTGKKRTIKWHATVKELYNELASEDATGFVFKSESNKVKYLNRAWTKEYVCRTLKKYAQRAGIDANIGTHSMRKTFGYHTYYQNGKDIVLVQRFLNHSSQAVTLRYIGIEQEKMDNAQLNIF